MLSVLSSSSSRMHDEASASHSHTPLSFVLSDKHTPALAYLPNEQHLGSFSLTERTERLSFCFVFLTLHDAFRLNIHLPLS